jgi:hypothetical protein
MKAMSNSLLQKWAQPADDWAADRLLGEHSLQIHQIMQGLALVPYRVYPQGSYANRTRVRSDYDLRASRRAGGAPLRGDVDIVVDITQPCYSRIAPVALTAHVYRVWLTVRHCLWDRLRKLNPAAEVTCGPRTITIERRREGLDVDIFPVVSTTDRQDEAVFWTLPQHALDVQERIFTYPRLHRRLIDSRDAQLRGRFREMARVFRAAALFARAHPYPSSYFGPAPGHMVRSKNFPMRPFYTSGWQIESVLIHLNDGYFEGSVPARFDRIVRKHQITYQKLKDLNLQPIVGTAEEDGSWTHWRDEPLYGFMQELAHHRGIRH